MAEKDGLKIICGALTRAKTPCARPPVPGRTRCKLHGGASLRGIEHPRFKTGRHSKVIPLRLAATYQEKLEDGEILSLVPDIALLDTRIEELLTQMTVATSTWEELRRAYRNLNNAARSEDRTAAEDAMRELGRIIGEGSAEASRWKDTIAVLKERRQLVDTERKLAFDEKNAVQAEQVLAMQGLILSIIHEHVHDRAIRKKISQAFERLLGPGMGS